MLSFLYPLFLLGAAAALVPIVVHLLRREAAPRLPFGAVRLLRLAPVERTRRRRLRELLLLAMRVCALLLLALAFARPYIGAAAGGRAPATIVAVDVSFSMGAPGQIERARELARAAIDAAPAAHLVGLVGFDDRVEVLAEPSGGRAASLAATERLVAGFGATRYGPALTRAAGLLDGRQGRLVVVTDLQQSGWRAGEAAAVPPGVVVTVADVGAPAGNLAVTAIRPDADRTVALVFNGGSEARTSRAELVLDGRVLAEAGFAVEAGAEAAVRFDAVLPDAGSASVRIEDPGGYPADDVRFMRLDEPDAPRVLAVASEPAEALYVEQALLAAGSEGVTLRTATGGEFARMTDEALAGHAAVLLLTTRGLDRRGRDALARFVERGGGLLVAAGPGVDPAVVSDLLAGRVVVEDAAPAAGLLSLAPADARHPIFRPFGALSGQFGHARFRRAAGLGGGDADRHVVARFSNGAPALVETAAGRGRLLVFASDFGNRWNDFPLQPTFAPFLYEAVRYVAREGEAPGSFVVGQAPPEVPREPGFATVGADRRRVAVNVDTTESTAVRLTEDEFAAALSVLDEAVSTEAGADAAGREARQGLWRFGLMLMLLALALEGFIGRRA